MTLIIAQREGDAVIVAADTKLTPEQDKPWRPIDQATKFFCLDDRWLLAFAGNAYVADKAITALPISPSFDTLRSHLLGANISSLTDGSEVEFLLLSIATLQIHKFSDGRCSRVQNSSWLGSKNAFEKYQALKDEASKVTPSKEPPSYGEGGMIIRPQVIDERRDFVHGTIEKILRILISDSSVSEVGGFVLSATVHKGDVRLWPCSGGIMSVPLGGLPSEYLRDAVFGNAAYGDFQYDVATSWNATDNVIAIALRAIKKVLVFKRWDGGMPYAKFIDISSDNWIDGVEQHIARRLWQVKVTSQGNVVTINSDPPKAA